MKDKRIFNVGSFNVRDLTKEYKRQQLANDIIKYNIDICCWQETKLQNGLDKNLNNHRIICLPSDSRHYGNGFIVSPKWKNNIYSYWKVSDRISVIQLQTSKVQQRYSSKLDGMKMKLMK